MKLLSMNTQPQVNPILPQNLWHRSQSGMRASRKLTE
jgi:hypothetical protein